MKSTTAEAKQKLRRTVRDTLSALTEQERQDSDRALFQRFLSLPQVEQAQTILAFWGIPGKEPDTARLVRVLTERGKTVCLPRMLPEHRMEVRRYLPEVPLKQAGFGIREPDGEKCPLVEQSDIDLALVPALCYDRQGFRLGFGGGYYDRWLETFHGVTAGLCRGAVLQDRVPTEPHDSRVEILLTEEETVLLRQAGKAPGGDSIPAAF